MLCPIFPYTRPTNGFVAPQKENLRCCRPNRFAGRQRNGSYGQPVRIVAFRESCTFMADTVRCHWTDVGDRPGLGTADFLHFLASFAMPETNKLKLVRRLG